jgi:hypothetical protein
VSPSPLSYAGHKVGENVSIDGVVTPEGRECSVIRDASGKLYGLTTTGDVLHPGDVVNVQGRVAPSDWCHQGVSIAVGSLHFRTHWGSSDVSDSRNTSDRGYAERGDSDRGYSERDRPGASASSYRSSSSDRTEASAPWTGLQIIRGVVTNEASDCPTIRADNGVLYSVSTFSATGRQSPLPLDQRVELRGTRSDHQTCAHGITFDVVEVRGR